MRESKPTISFFLSPVLSTVPIPNGPPNVNYTTHFIFHFKPATSLLYLVTPAFHVVDSGSLGPSCFPIRSGVVVGEFWRTRTRPVLVYVRPCYHPHSVGLRFRYGRRVRRRRGRRFTHLVYELSITSLEALSFKSVPPTLMTNHNSESVGGCPFGVRSRKCGG